MNNAISCFMEGSCCDDCPSICFLRTIESRRHPSVATRSRLVLPLNGGVDPRGRSSKLPLYQLQTLGPVDVHLMS